MLIQNLSFINYNFKFCDLGASSVVGMVGNIIANVIAFVSFFSMLDVILIWFFEMINLRNFGFGVRFLNVCLN